jgi:hypothetical protein
MNIDWSFVLAPLVVLPVVWVFRFVGCASFGTADSPAPSVPGVPVVPPVVTPPSYPDYILGKAGGTGTLPNPLVVPNPALVVGYWRLVDGPASGQATDEKAGHHGAYRGDSSTDSSPVPTTRIAANQPSLLLPTAGELGRNFTGGYVLVPWAPALATAEFTFEAWVRPQGWVPTDAGRRRLVTFGGDYRDSPAAPSRDHGFVIEQDNGQLRARVARGDGRAQTLAAVLPAGVAHVALTVQKISGPNDRRRATLYLNATAIRVLEFDGYVMPSGVPLLLASGPNPDDPRGTFTSRAPWTGRVQEVVLHSTALTAAELANHVAINTNAGSTA